MPVHISSHRPRSLVTAALCLALSLPATALATVDAPVAVTPSALVPAAAAALPAFTGTITDARLGAKVGAVQVTAYRMNAGQWTAVARAESAADGTFAITGLPAGTYRVGATDWSGRYSDAFYSRAGSLATATDIVYTGTTVPAISLQLVRDPVVRVYDADRYSTAVQMVYEQYTDPARGVVDFRGVTTVVLACGDDAAAADPLAASGLAYTYQVTDPSSPNAKKGAPLVLVPRSGPVPHAVRQLVTDIAHGDPKVGITGNGTGRIRLLAVGGTGSVPASRLDAIESLASAVGVKVTRDRIAGSDRYDLARRIAERMKSVAATDPNDSVRPPMRALVANGADPRTFFDALALAPIAAYTGSPVLPVAAGSVPGPTRSALSALGLSGSDVWVAGGGASVSDTVMRELGVPGNNRLAGRTRYATAVAVAYRAGANGWLPAATNGHVRGAVVASRLADALAGGAFAGDAEYGYPLLLASPGALAPETARFLYTNRDSVRDAVLLGGPSSMGEGTVAGVRSALR